MHLNERSPRALESNTSEPRDRMLTNCNPNFMKSSLMQSLNSWTLPMTISAVMLRIPRRRSTREKWTLMARSEDGKVILQSLKRSQLTKRKTLSIQPLLLWPSYLQTAPSREHQKHYEKRKSLKERANEMIWIQKNSLSQMNHRSERSYAKNFTMHRSQSQPPVLVKERSLSQTTLVDEVGRNVSNNNSADRRTGKNRCRIVAVNRNSGVDPSHRVPT